MVPSRNRRHCKQKGIILGMEQVWSKVHIANRGATQEQLPKQQWSLTAFLLCRFVAIISYPFINPFLRCHPFHAISPSCEFLKIADILCSVVFVASSLTFALASVDFAWSPVLCICEN